MAIVESLLRMNERRKIALDSYLFAPKEDRKKRKQNKFSVLHTLSHED